MSKRSQARSPKKHARSIRSQETKPKSLLLSQRQLLAVIGVIVLASTLATGGLVRWNAHRANAAVAPQPLPPPFATHGDFVRYAQEQGLVFTTPPKRPEAKLFEE